MRRRVLSIMLSAALIIGTCGQFSVQGYAAEINEQQNSNSFETGICSEKGTLGDYEYTISYDALSESVTEMEVIDKEDKKLTLRVEEDMSCLALYNAGDDTVYSASFAPEEYSSDSTLLFKNEDELSEDNAKVNDMFGEALEIWEQALAKEMDTNLVAVGFTSEFVVEINEAIAEAAESETNTNTEEVTTEETTVEETTVDETSEGTAVEEETVEVLTEEAATEISTEAETIAETVAETVVEDITVEESTDELMENELGEPLNPAAQRIVLNQTAITLYGPVVKGMEKSNYDTFQLKASVFPENWSPDDASEKIVWSSSDESVATVVSTNGLVRAEAIESETATATITATITEGAKTISASCVVTVLKCEITEDEAGEEILPGIWMSGFNEGTDSGKEIYYTGGKITQNLRIFDHKKLLVQGQDYTLTYKNNINARGVDKLNSPSVTIKMKGQYSGSKVLYFAITPRALSETTNTTLEAAMTSSAKLQKFNPTVIFGNKRLVKGTDYTIEYYATYWDDDDDTNDTIATNDFAKYYHSFNQRWTVTYKLTGKGNYSGTMLGTYDIVPKAQNLANAAVTYTKTVKYAGTPITVDDLNIKIKLPGESAYSELTSTSDKWQVTISNTDMPGKSTFTITPRSAYKYIYAGKIAKSFTIAATYNLKDVAEVAPGWLEEIRYNKAVSEKTDTLTGKKMGMRQDIADDSLLVAKPEAGVSISGDDYTVTYSANLKVGTAKVTFRGKGKCKGSFAKTFKITYGGALSVNSIADVTYVLGGVSPVVTVTDEDGTELKKNTDYTVTYSNNKKAGEAKVVIKGKGNYAKAERKEVTYNILPASIEGFKVVVADKVVSTKANKYMSKPAVYDVNGKKLVEGRDYSKLTLDDYYYENKDITDTPGAQTVINVSVNGINNYKDSTTGCYKLYDKSKSIANLQIVIDPQIYTGQAIEPVPVVNPADSEDKGAIHVYLTARDKKYKTNEKNAAEYVEVVSYTNNIKAGTAKVTLKGIGEYGGTRTVAFKINKKTLITNRVTNVILSKNGLPTKFYPGTIGHLEAYVNPIDADNDRIVWTTSNSKLIRINEVTTTIVDGAKVSRVEIESVGEGVATIKAVAQDNGKSKGISISTKTKPVTLLQISKTTLNLSSGQTEKLTYTAGPSDAFMDRIGWFSTNTTVATVDAEGNVTANHAGSAYIVVKDFNKSPAKDRNSGVTACCFITVKESTSAMINVKDYGLVAGNASKGDSNKKAFDDAIAQAKSTGKSVYVPAGTYYITAKQSAANSVVFDENCKNISLVMDSGAVLRGVDCSDRDSRVMWLNDTSNISITGGTIIGGKSGDGGVVENAHGIRINSSSNIVISGVTIRDCYGDGIYLGSRVGASASSSVDIINCSLSGNKRHNFSLVNSQYIRIDGCNIKNPAHGLIDIEANLGCANRHIKITNNTITTIGNGAIVAILNTADDIEISGNRISGGTGCYIENRSGTRVTYNGRTISPGEYFDV